MIYTVGYIYSSMTLCWDNTAWYSFFSTLMDLLVALTQPFNCSELRFMNKQHTEIIKIPLSLIDFISTAPFRKSSIAN